MGKNSVKFSDKPARKLCSAQDTDKAASETSTSTIAEHHTDNISDALGSPDEVLSLQGTDCNDNTEPAPPTEGMSLLAVSVK